MYGFVALLLLMFALVAFIISGGWAGEPQRWKLLCYGLAAATGAFLIMIGPTVYEHWIGK